MYQFFSKSLIAFCTILMCCALHAEQKSICQGLVNSKELYECLVAQNLEIQRSQAEAKSSELLSARAGQRLNPELGLEAFKTSSKSRADQLGQPTTQWSASLMVPVELGGKRKSRIEEARAVSQVRHEELNLTTKEVKQLIVISLYRLKQLKIEQTMLNEAIHTFGKLTGQFRRRPQLSPEQQVTRSVFAIAGEDYQLKLTQSHNEERELLRFFTTNSGLSAEVLEKLLPKTRTSWPAIDREMDIKSSPSIRLNEAQLRLTQRQLDLADSEAWPDIRVGPIFNRQTQTGQDIDFIGLGVTAPLPLFSTNQGARSYAASQVQVAALQSELSKKTETARLSQLKDTYSQIVSTL